MRFLLIALIALGLSSTVPTVASAQQEKEDAEQETNLEPPRPDGAIRSHDGPRHQWSPERWLDEAYYLEGEVDLVGAVDALQTALRLGGGGQRHAYDLGRLLLELLRGGEAREAFCLARLGPDEEWKRLAEERLAELGDVGPDWCGRGDDWDPHDWRRNMPSTTPYTGKARKRSPCDRAMDRAWALKNAEKYVAAVAAFGEAEKVCPNKQLIELEVAYCLLLLERPDAASVSLFEVTLGPDARLVQQADRQLSVMPKPSPEEAERRAAEAEKRHAEGNRAPVKADDAADGATDGAGDPR